MLEEAEEVIKAVASDCEFALARFEEKKCYIRNQVISEFSHHFNQLKGFELTNKKDSMENIQLFFSLSQDAIATMKKHNYDVSHYNQKENDQIATTYSTLMTLSAFLEAPIMDEHQKLNEATQSKLEFMQREMNSLETKHYDLIDSTKIKFGLARRLFEFFRSFWGKNGRIKKANNS
ncbi:sortase [Helicobacter pylori]|uniref:sortase n=1 Tax=Helicobacter pylori TaxID=210 RepID=UPI0013E32A5A|nr:sortase [Helicobacter pylori]